MREDKSIYFEEIICNFEYDLVLREWTKRQTTINELTPEQSPFQCKKSMAVDVCLCREKEDLNSVSGKSMFYYLRKMKIAVRKEASNVWLTMGKDGRVYVKLLDKMLTYRLDPANGDPLIIVKKLSEKRISKEQALQLKTGYVFSKVEQIDENTELLGTYVKPVNT